MSFEVSDILALISNEQNVGDNWRVIHPFKRLRQAGINARYYWGDDHTVLPTDPEQTILVVRLMTGTDERTIDRWIAERRSQVRAIIWEGDDVAWGDAMVTHLRDADFLQGKSEAELIHQGEMAKYLASQCDGVITSSEPLSALVRRDIPGQHVVTLANAIDTRWFRAQMAYRAPWADHLTIGWCGGRRPEADVVPMAEAWGRIARRYPHVRFVVASSLIPDVFYREIEDDSRIIRLPWVSWTDSPVLYQCSINCVAVADSAFSRCKTPIKLYEGTVAGAAVIGTKALYGPCLARGIIDPVETAEEWADALSYLIEHEDARRAQQAALLAHVERCHSLDGNLMQWPAAYRAIVEARETVAA